MLSTRTFSAQSLLDLGTVPTARYRRAEIIFSPGDAGVSVMYVQQGGVKLSVSKNSREAVVAMLGPGDFFGEECLAAQPTRTSGATAMTPATIVVIKKDRMIRLLRQNAAVADRFRAHVLVRNINIEEDLIAQVTNSSEKRLARVLLRLARYDTQHPPQRVLRNVSAEALAEKVGTTPARIDVLMAKFRKAGFIEDNHGLTIKRSLLSVVLRQ